MNNDYDLIPEIDLNKYEELEVTLEAPVDGFSEENSELPISSFLLFYYYRILNFNCI